MIRSTNFDPSSLASLRQAKRTQLASAHAQSQMKMGKRIVSARDDSSGAAIAARLKARAISADEGLRNMNEALAAIGIAEGVLDSITSSVNTLKALGVRAHTQLKTIADVALVNNEKNKILSSIRKAVRSAEYNGKNLLTGGLAAGAAVNYGLGSVAVALSTATLAALGISNLTFMAGANVLMPAAALSAQISGVNTAISRLSAMKGRLGAMQSQVESLIESTESNLDKTEEARSVVEDKDSLEAQVDAATSQNKENLAMQAFLLALQTAYRGAQSTMQTMQLMMSS